MPQELVKTIIYDLTYPQIYGLTFLYFLILYFAIAPVFLLLCELLSKYQMAHLITLKEVSKKQTRFEMMHSLKSIFIFGFSSLPVIYLIQVNSIELIPDTALNIFIGVLLLTVWNEVHFFVIHRIMHIPFLMKKVHVIHHKSVIPSVYSVYSFHWLEAFLLSTVPITLVPFVPFSAMAIFLYPSASILLNFSGHCNYRLGSGTGADWKLFATRHNAHHSRFTDNYGFASNLLDKLNKYITGLIQSKKK